MTHLKLWIRDVVSILFCLGRKLLGVPGERGLRILVYHTIATIAPRQDRWRLSVPPLLLETHLRWLRRRGYTFVSLGEALEMLQGKRPMPAKAVLITFDDGFHDVLTAAYPLLRREQVPAAIFVVPCYLAASEPFPWLDGGALFNRPLTWDELYTLASDSVISVGSHSWSHRRLSELTIQEQYREIAKSKLSLEARLGRAVLWFAYPYGHQGSFSEETIECLKEAGFEAACMNVMGVNRVGDSPWRIKRTRVGWEDRLWRFGLKMAGAYDWVDRWRLPTRMMQRPRRQVLPVEAAEQIH